MPLLAQILGQTTHLSPLARKLKRLGLPDAQSWWQLAVQRGCRHYAAGLPDVDDPGETRLDNSELLTALLLGQNAYDPALIRIAGQLLGGEPDAARVIFLARQERVLTPLRHVVEQALVVEPANPYWRLLADKLPVAKPAEGLLPHRTRFTTSVTTGPLRLRSPAREVWLRPAPKT